MIDIHCHILPDVDDGAASMDESLEMARMALSSGVKEIVATPHFRGEPEYLEQLPLIDQRYLEMKEALARWKVPLKLHKGAEVLCTPQTLELIRSERLPTMGDSRYVLTEFFFDETFSFMEECLLRLITAGYRPVVAHPERYRSVQRDPFRVLSWVNRDVALQLNKGSLFGAFGVKAEKAANDLLGLGFAHIIASDAHSCRSRTPHMGMLLDWAEEYCDPDCAQMLLEENPKRILQNQPMAGFGTDY